VLEAFGAIARLLLAASRGPFHIEPLSLGRINVKAIAVRTVLGVTGLSVLGYLALCIVARVGYRAVLYPVPLADPAPAPQNAEAHVLRSSDGAEVRALTFARPTRRSGRSSSFTPTASPLTTTFQAIAGGHHSDLFAMWWGPIVHAIVRHASV